MPRPKLTREECFRCVEMFLDGTPITMFSKAQREGIKGKRYEWSPEIQQAVKTQLSINLTRGSRQWTWQQVKEMRNEYNRGVPLKDIHAKYGGSYDAVLKAIAKRTYKDVAGRWNRWRRSQFTQTIIPKHLQAKENSECSD